MVFIEVQSLAGINYVRAGDVIAVQYVDPRKSTVVMGTGTLVQCNEPAKDIAERVEAAVAASRVPAQN